MKRLLALLVAAGLCLPLVVGCGDDTAAKKDKAGKAGTTAPPSTGDKGKDKGATPAPAPTTPPKDKDK